MAYCGAETLKGGEESTLYSQGDDLDSYLSTAIKGLSNMDVHGSTSKYVTFCFVLGMYTRQYAHYAPRFKHIKRNQAILPNTNRICSKQLKTFQECKTDITYDFTILAGRSDVLPGRTTFTQV